MSNFFTYGRPTTTEVIRSARELPVSDRVRTLLNDAETHDYGLSGQKFHRAPSVKDVLTAPRLAFIRGFTDAEISSYCDLYHVLRLFYEASELPYPTRFRQERSRGKNRRRATVAVLPRTVQGLSSEDRAHLALLTGRVHTHLVVSTAYWAALVDKKGISFTMPDKFHEQYPNAAVAAALAVSDMCGQRAFTTETANKGKLTELTQSVADAAMVVEREATAAAMARLHPVYAALCDRAQCVELFTQWMHVAVQLAPALECLWQKGVRTRVWKHGSRVPSRRSSCSVDSSAWNRLSGAWNAAVRSIRSLSAFAGYPNPVLLPTTCLVAGDVAQMFAYGMYDSDDRERVEREQQKLSVYSVLAEKNVRGWSPLLVETKDTVMCKMRSITWQSSRSHELIKKLCAEQDPVLPHGAFLGTVRTVLSKERNAELPMLCGIPVHADHVEWMKKAGFFGATEWSNQ